MCMGVGVGVVAVCAYMYQLDLVLHSFQSHMFVLILGAGRKLLIRF